MSSYAIGDIQGCHAELVDLLDTLHFDANRDHVIFVGDLVNRGPSSLEVLRYVRALGNAATTLLGNHDLHLLAVASGGKPGRRDTLNDVLIAPDRDELLDWLIRQPLAWRHAESGALLVHAGLAPQWTVAQTLELAQEASALISGTGGARFLSRMYGDEPGLWKDKLRGTDRTRFVVNCLTRLRYCRADGSMDLRPKTAPGKQPRGLLPWFQMPGRESRGSTVVFGHWSTLGKMHWAEEQVYGLDTGCIWGGKLSALNLDTGEVTQVASHQPRPPDPEPD